MKVLGIETSCDETAASVMELAAGGQSCRMLSNVVASSMDLHKAYGGVVPEIAARSHIEAIIPTINQALEDAGCDWDGIDSIAVTYGAGLSGSLLIGVMTARTLAITFDKPLYGANHVMGHVYANFVTDTALPGFTLPAEPPKFPLLAIIVSGGHSQLALFKDYFDYQLLGRTRDDAIGEAFDKVAKIVGLPYPGGPSVAKKAQEGDAAKYKLPIAKVEGKYDFSFSGLKTAVLRMAQSETGHDYTFASTQLPAELSEQQKADIAASFQYTAVKTIVSKAKLAAEEFRPASVVIAGGVAANQELRRQLTEALPERPPQFTDIKLCTDNGAMIAALGCFMAKCNQKQSDPNSLAINPNLAM